MVHDARVAQARSENQPWNVCEVQDGNSGREDTRGVKDETHDAIFSLVTRGSKTAREGEREELKAK